MSSKESISPLLVKYLKIYEKDPTSIVFAPLAETYRKLGMVDKAIRVLEHGLKQNPEYYLGYIVLGSCYHDLGEHTKTYELLKPLVPRNRDNVRMQKLFADVCLGIGKFDDALETYKYMLFLNPKDPEAALQVKRLENEDISGNSLENRTSKLNENKFFKVDELDISREADEWSSVVTTKAIKEKSDKDEITIPNIEEAQDEIEEWQVGNISHNSTGQNINQEAPITNKKIEIDPVSEVEEELESNDELVTRDTISEDSPVITHTLVDLYCSQGYHDKALEILKKMLLLNPKDSRTIKKIKELEGVVEENKIDEGRQNLMNLFDNKIATTPKEEIVSVTSQSIIDIEKKMIKFLTLVQERASQVLADS